MFRRKSTTWRRQASRSRVTTTVGLEKLAQVRQDNRHSFPGTAFRSIVRNQNDPDEIEIFLAWREAVLPAIEEKEAALAALSADLADVFDWNTATTKECLTLLHAQ